MPPPAPGINGGRSMMTGPPAPNARRAAGMLERPIYSKS